MVFVEELDEVPADSVVVVSAHGVAPSVFEQAAWVTTLIDRVRADHGASVRGEGRLRPDSDDDVVVVASTLGDLEEPRRGYGEVVGSSGRIARYSEPLQRPTDSPAKW